MADTTVTIASDGTPTPSDVRVQPGDTVSFRADGADVVLCTGPPTFFGQERHEIRSGGTADLTVQADAPASFEFTVAVGDMSAQCGGTRDKTRGGVGGID